MLAEGRVVVRGTGTGWEGEWEWGLGVGLVKRARRRTVKGEWGRGSGTDCEEGVRAGGG